MPKINQAVLALIELKVKNALRQGGYDIDRIASTIMHLPKYASMGIEGDIVVLTIDPSKIGSNTKLLTTAGIDPSKLSSYGFIHEPTNLSDRWSLQMTSHDIVNTIDDTIGKMTKKGTSIIFTGADIWNAIQQADHTTETATTQWIVSQGGALSLTDQEPGIDEIGIAIDTVEYRMEHLEGKLTQIAGQTIFMSVSDGRVSTMSLLNQTDMGIKVHDLRHNFDGEQVTIDLKANVSPMMIVGGKLPNFVADQVDGMRFTTRLETLISSLDADMNDDDQALGTWQKAGSIPADAGADQG